MCQTVACGREYVLQYIRGRNEEVRSYQTKARIDFSMIYNSCLSGHHELLLQYSNIMYALLLY